nr:LysR family transcriptional regulator [Serratia entomophila]
MARVGGGSYTFMHESLRLAYMVKQGRGIACLPDYSVKEALATGEVEPILNNDMTHTTTFICSGPARGR